MNDAKYWKRYVLEEDPAAIEHSLQKTTFEDGELIYFEKDPRVRNILISIGSSGHAYLFAELGYRMHERGFNVFIMPKQGGLTIPELVDKHEHALGHIAKRWNDRIGVFAEGLGGYAAFYLALRHGPMRSLVCQNSPAILTEPAFHEATLTGRRAMLLPILRVAAKAVPGLKFPISSYLDFREMIDTKEPTHTVEARLIENYGRDPDFDRSYPLPAILSLLDAPPPGELSGLQTPTMFMVPIRGFAPEYARSLFARLPPIRKKLVEVDGSVFWMVSHSREAAGLICGWFDETL
jgi:pimeloyl-ACP methyl ester carboxylesterase